MYTIFSKQSAKMDLNYLEIINATLQLQSDIVFQLIKSNDEIFQSDLLKYVFSVCFSESHYNKSLTDKDLFLIKSSSNKLKKIIENIHSSEPCHNDLKSEIPPSTVISKKEKSFIFKLNEMLLNKSKEPQTKYCENLKQHNISTKTENTEPNSMTLSKNCIKKFYKEINTSEKKSFKASTTELFHLKQTAEKVTFEHYYIKTILTEILSLYKNIFNKPNESEPVLMKFPQVFSTANQSSMPENLIQTILWALPFFSSEKIKTFTSKSKKINLKKVNRKENSNNDEEKEENEKNTPKSLDDLL